MAYNEVFGGATLYPSDLTYLALTTAVDVQLTWPVEQQIAGQDVVADIMDITTSVASLNIDMPDARQVSNGIQSVFVNVGGETFAVRDNTGGAIISVAPGEAWVAYLTSNATQAGTWRTFQLGATVSVANASALAGAGIKAISTTLNQQIDSDVEAAVPFTVVDGDRAKCLIFTGGAGVCNLPNPATVGNDWFFMLRNSGSGDLTVTPPAGTIDGVATTDFSPGESAFIFTDGTNFFTIGFGQSSTSVFDFVSIAVPGSGNFTLSGANLDRISYRFTGILTGDRKIVVPATVQQYWVDNQTTGAFALTVGTLAQVTSPEVPQGDRAILYSDATDVVNATTSSITFPITIAQGGTGAITAAAALANLGGVPTTRLVNTTAPLAGGGALSGDLTLTIPVPTETTRGAPEIATQAEADAGSDDVRYITPLKLATNLGTLIQGAVKAATTSRSSTTTNTDDPDLAGFGLEPSSQYLLRCALRVDGNGATNNDFKWIFDFNGQIGNVTVISGTQIWYPTGSADAPIDSTDANFFSGLVDFTTGGLVYIVEIELGIVTGAGYVSGTAVDLQWAQNVSQITATRLLAGSSMEVLKVA